MTDRERWWLQATVWMEARGESFQGQQAVAHVILNRLHSKRWGHAVGAVCLAPMQFSAWNSDSPTRKALAYVNEALDGSWQQVSQAIRQVLNGKVPDPTDGALHYYATTLPKPPFWDDPTLPRVVIGRHVFVRDVP